MKIIGVEEHIDLEGPFGCDNLEKRLQDMDEAGIDMQVISFVLDHDESLEASKAASMVKNINDNLYKVVERYPEKFAAFATVAFNDPDAAAAELERAVTQLGFKGMFMASGIGREYLDEPKYATIIATAARLDVPIYIHPGPMSPEMSRGYETYQILNGPMWRFACDTGLQAVRLMCSGVFEKYPKLQVMLGHLGEGIPYWMWRMDNMWEKVQKTSAIPNDSRIDIMKKKPSQYFADHFYVTTSGMFWQPALQLVHSTLGAGKILFAVDYPPESSIEAVKAVASMPISDADKEKIFHLNAEKLLGL